MSLIQLIAREFSSAITCSAIIVSTILFSYNFQKKKSCNNKTTVNFSLYILTLISSKILILGTQHIVFDFVCTCGVCGLFWLNFDKNKKLFKSFHLSLSDTNIERIKGAWVAYIIALSLSCVALVFGYYYVIHATFCFFPFISLARLLNCDEKKHLVEKTDTKYLKAKVLSIKEKEHIGSKIKELMEGDKIYNDPLLDLSKMAKRVGISKNSLSQFINEEYSKSFLQFIAEYRVDEATILLNKENTRLTITEIAYQVGFSSISTFNSWFKKKYKVPPSKYRTICLG